MALELISLALLSADEPEARNAMTAVPMFRQIERPMNAAIIERRGSFGCREFSGAFLAARALIIATCLQGAVGVALAEDQIGTPTYHTLSLDGEWSVVAQPLDHQGEEGYKVFAVSDAERMSARVPGEIHLDLMRAGKMEDPSVSDNARTRSRWPEEHSWWYRTEFTPPAGFREHFRQRLVFDGIDLWGQVFVNGRLAGTTRNAFAAHEFDVSSLLKEGSNELVVRVTSGTELVPSVQTGILTLFSGIHAIRNFDQRRLLRKPAYTYGWDWCDPLPNVGIVRGVRLEGRSKVVIHDLRLDTVIEGDEVALSGIVTLENLHAWSEIPSTLEIRIDPPEGAPIEKRILFTGQLGRSTAACRIVIPNPRLWWPNGMGEQPLYNLTARVICDDEETDRLEQTIGLRTIELDRSPLPEGSRFAFLVNGKRMFAKGGNWAPADLIPARIDAARYQALVAEAKNAHFNMLRVNGVGLYESEDFYDACDRAGILVWQDFTLSVGVFPDDDPGFVASVRDEAEKAVKRLRHRASLALWCANNENTWIFLEREKDPVKARKIGGVRLYNEVLPDICQAHDPVRPYWPGSPSGGLQPNSETSGDCHWWVPFTMNSDMKRRLRHEVVDECRARFVSEYGILGPPNIASVRQFLKTDELSLESEAWKIHTNSIEGGTISAGISHHYGSGDTGPLSLPQFVLYGQMFQAMMQGGVLEGLRFRKDDLVDDCQGALVWSYNDCWGETGWSIIDHYLRRKASYYWFKRAATPVKVIVRPRGDELVTRVVNDTMSARDAVVSIGWIRLDGSAREIREIRATIPANGMIEIARDALPSASERDPGKWLYAAVMRGEGIPDDQAIWLLAPHRELALAEPVISVSERDGMLEVSSDVYCHSVHLEDEGREVIEDNFFDLLPGVPRRIPITNPTPSGTYPLAATMPLGGAGQGDGVRTSGAATN
jgi:beta-mannosidase